MNNKLAQDAISAALSGNWKSALKINKTITKLNSQDIDALNRLSRAHAELGDIPKARKIAKKVLKLDPFNSIAPKALEKWKGLKKGETYVSGPSSAQVFLEESGKTKIVSLLYLGSLKVLAKLDSGNEVKLKTRSHRVSVLTNDGKYIGRLPDDLSCHLRRFIRHGNKYRVFIKSTDKKDVKIFIRETKRVKKLADFPSFPTTPPKLIHEKNSP